MDSKAKIFGHAIHPMLIVFPLGLLATSVGFDVAYLFSRNAHWADIAYYLMAVGIISGLAAAVFGLVDWVAIPSNTRAKSVGLIHGLGNVVVVALFAGSWWLRRETPASPPLSASYLSFAGAALAIITGWLGGELVERLGISIHPGAHMNAPSSLSGEQAAPPDKAMNQAADIPMRRAG